VKFAKLAIRAAIFVHVCNKLLHPRPHWLAYSAPSDLLAGSRGRGSDEREMDVNERSEKGMKWKG